MPRLRIVGRDDVARSLLVKPENVARYAPLPATNPKTGRTWTVYLRRDDTITVRRQDLPREVLEDIGEEPGPANLDVLVTAGTDYDPESGNSRLIIEASFRVVVPGESNYQAAIEEALRDVFSRSGLPSDGLKIGFDVEGQSARGVGVVAASVRFGTRRKSLKRYAAGEQAAIDSLTDAIGRLERVDSLPSSEATRRLSAVFDSGVKRYRGSDGRFSKAPSSVVVLD